MLKKPAGSPSRVVATWFSTPTRGSSRSIHPRVVESAGMKHDSQNRNSSPRAQGTFVRARAQASTMPIGNEIAWYENATESVFQSDWSNPGALHASIQGWRL